MARVLIETQPWGVIQDVSGNALIGQSVHIANTDTTAATTWSAQTGGSSTTADQTTGSNGAIPRYIEVGEYDIIVAGVTKRVEALSGVRATDAWAPGSSICDNGIRLVSPDNITLTSAQLFLAGGCVLPNRVQISSMTFVSGATAAVTPTNQWACLVDTGLNVLAKSADRTTEAWGALAAKTFTLSSPYTPTVDTPVYVGLVVVAATVNNLRGHANSGTIIGLSPSLGGGSTTALTTPASLGATVTAPTAGNGVPYTYLS
jgi:hypothetical protein